MSDKSNLKQLEDKVIQRAVNSDKFRRWFGNSQVTNSNGDPLIVYRGDFRSDSMGNSFDKNKATSGRFYFTDDPQIASQYSTNKSYVDEDRDYQYYDYFRVKSDRDGKFYNLKDAWKKLSGKKKLTILRKAKQVNINSSNEVVSHEDPNSKIPQQQVDFIANRETKGNYLWALSEAFLASAIIMIEQDKDAVETFEKILEFVGFNPTDIHYDNPMEARSGVTPVFLSIERPLDTSKDVDAYFYDDLIDQVENDWDTEDALGKDAWNKFTRTKDGLFEQLADDIENNESRSWTSIPEPITIALQEMGFDGIKDVGGKMGGSSHTVWIAFEPEQIKSIYNNGEWDSESDNIMESKKIIKEFTEKDANHLDKIYTIWNQIVSDVKSETEYYRFIDDYYDAYVITYDTSPILKEYKLAIIFGDIGDALGHFTVAKNAILKRYTEKYLILMTNRNVNLNNNSLKKIRDESYLDSIKDDIVNLMKDNKHVFVHEFTHLLDLTKGETNIPLDKAVVLSKKVKTTKDYHQLDFEWKAFIKEIYSQMFHTYKQMDKYTPQLLEHPNAFSRNLDEFIDFWKLYVDHLDYFIRIEKELDQKYQRKFKKVLYKLQQYMIKNLK